MITRCEQILNQYLKTDNPRDNEVKPKRLGKGFEEVLNQELSCIKKEAKDE